MFKNVYRKNAIDLLVFSAAVRNEKKKENFLSNTLETVD